MNGWINLGKPLGMTSAQAVSRIKRALPRGTKIGHAGTLDPLADGVLPLAIGEATKMIPLLHMDDKTYRFSIQWGYETTTDDREGDAHSHNDMRPSQDAIDAVLPRFRGSIEQVPPAFSALKINGQRAYDLARAGENVVLAPRTVEIYDLTLIRHSRPSAAAREEGHPVSKDPLPSVNDGLAGDDISLFQCTCGTGTYIRSLARDIARACGGAGHVGVLTRTRVGPFGLENAFLLDKDGQNVDKEDLLQALLPVDYGLDDIPAVTIGAHEEARLRLGQEVVVGTSAFEDPVLIYGPNGIVGIGIRAMRTLKPKRLLNL